MVTRRKYVTKEDLDAGLADLRKDLDAGLADLREATKEDLSAGLAGLREEMRTWKTELQRSFDVAVETIRADIKVFGEQRTVPMPQAEIPEVERLSNDLEMVKAVVREHSKDIAELKSKR